MNRRKITPSGERSAPISRLPDALLEVEGQRATQQLAPGRALAQRTRCSVPRAFESSRSSARGAVATGPSNPDTCVDGVLSVVADDAAAVTAEKATSVNVASRRATPCTVH
jgi:hypothetical protein